MPSAPPPAVAAAVAAASGWDVCLLGGLRATRGTHTLTQFGSRATAALLARLALHPLRAHPREELIELLWPGVEIDVGRNRLRQTLFALRQLLEHADADPAAALLQADRHGVRVAPGALQCDARRFEAAVRAGRHTEARALYGGELLPGFYDDWVADERLRLAALFDRVEAAPPPPPPLPPPPPPAADLAPTLPTYLTRFFGRDTEGARLRAEVLAHRLVTLLGPGGSGKTRLAAEVAGSLAASLTPAASPGRAASPPPSFDQIIFAPLVTCQTGAQMLDALLAAARLNAGGRSAAQALGSGLAGRRVLLVLDNVEQLGAEAQQVALELLAGLPALHLLVTSRHVLGLDGEREFAVAPLHLPHAGMPLDLLAINPAVALFVDRARAARADFHLSDGNRDGVVALVRELAGMPLALELAASRLRSLSCTDMLALLRPAGGTGAAAQPHLALLSRPGPRAGGDPRHASMQRVVEWSWQQLAPAPAQLLAALTVFEGGFTVTAVHAVCDAAPPGAHGLLDELVAHSLVHRSDGGADAPDDAASNASNAGRDERAARFGIYEPIREFAAAQQAPGATLALRARHRAWLAGWMRTLGHRVPLAALRDEMRNLLAALRSALDDGAPAEALQLLLALRAGADELALPAHAIDLLETALAQTTDPVLASRAHTLLGRLCLVAGRGEAARRHADAGLASAPADPALRARALLAQASVRWRSSRDGDGLEAQLDEAEALALQCADLETEASVHSLRAFVRHVAHRDLHSGQALNERALALWERAGNAHAVNRIRYNLAVNAHHARRHAEALERLHQVAAQARAERDWQQLSKALNMQGEALMALRRWPDALAAYRDCVRVAWAAGEMHALAYGLWNLPQALARAHQPEAAARLAGFAGHYWRTHVGRLDAADERDLRRHRRLAAVQIGHAAAAVQAERGERLTLAEAVALALEPAADAVSIAVPTPTPTPLRRLLSQR